MNFIFFEKILDAPLRTKNAVKKATLKSSKKEKTKFEVTVGPRGTSEFIRVLGRICWRRRCFFCFLQIFTSQRTEVHQSPLPSLPLENRPSPESSSRFWYGGTGVCFDSQKAVWSWSSWNEFPFYFGEKQGPVLINAAFCSLKRFLQYFKLCAYFFGVGLDWLRFGSQRYHRIHRFKSFE